MLRITKNNVPDPRKGDAECRVEDDEETRITSLEAEGLTRSDAQGVVDAEDMVSRDARSEGYSFPEEDEHRVFHEKAFDDRYQHGQLGRI